jgi:hypothetical protein
MAMTMAMAGGCVRYRSGGRSGSGAIAAVSPGSRAQIGRGWSERLAGGWERAPSLDLQLTDSYSMSAQCTSMHAMHSVHSVQSMHAIRTLAGGCPAGRRNVTAAHDSSEAGCAAQAQAQALRTPRQRQRGAQLVQSDTGAFRGETGGVGSRRWSSIRPAFREVELSASTCVRGRAAMVHAASAARAKPHLPSPSPSLGARA